MWHWKSDDGWKPYSQKQHDEIEAKLRAGERSFSLANSKYDVDLDEMKQTNRMTQFSRSIQKQPPKPSSAISSDDDDHDDDDDGVRGRIWQWEDDGNIWRSYNPKQQAEIVSNLINGNLSFTFSGSHYKIDLGKDEQTNVNSGHTRRVRVLDLNDGSDDGSDNVRGHIWQWEDDGHIWKSYNPKQQAEIVSNLINGNLSFTFSGSHYKIDVEKYEQTNVNSGHTRRVRVLDLNGGIASHSGNSTAATKSSDSDTPATSSTPGSVSGGGTSTAATKSSDADTFEWQVKDGGRWVDYDLSAKFAIENILSCSLSGKDGKGEVRVGTQLVSVDVGKLREYNPKNGTSREIRRNPPYYAVWQYEDDKKGWQNYAPKLYDALDTAYFRSGDCVDVGNSRVVDPYKEIQWNTETGTRRRVRRRGSISHLWQFRRKKEWQDFDQKITDTIEGCFQRGTDSAAMDFDGKKYVARPCVSKFESADKSKTMQIRRLPQVFRWEYCKAVGRKDWTRYSADRTFMNIDGASMKIEDAFRSGGAVDIQNGSSENVRVYPHLLRDRNLKTNEVCLVRRVPEAHVRWYYRKRRNWTPYPIEDSAKIEGVIMDAKGRDPSVITISGRSIDVAKGIQKGKSGYERPIRRVPPFPVQFAADDGTGKKIEYDHGTNLQVEDILFRNRETTKASLEFTGEGTRAVDLTKLRKQVVRKSTDCVSYRHLVSRIFEKPRYVPVARASLEWGRIERKVKESVRGHRIKKMWRVVNPILEFQYEQKRQTLRRAIDTGENEMKDVFHGASDLKVLDYISLGGLNDGGFDTRIGKNMGNYGRGAYFAHHAIYCVGIHPKMKTFLVADILLGRCEDHGDKRAGHLKRPEGKYHTIQATETSIGVVGSATAKRLGVDISTLAKNPKGDVEYGRQYVTYEKPYATPRFKIELEEEC